MSKFLKITWRDAEDFGSTWSEEEEAIEFAGQDCLVESYGFLIKQTKLYILLAADRTLSGNKPGELGRLCKIPRKMVVTSEEIALTPSPVL